MSLDFWAVKIKKDKTEEDFKKGDYWSLIENDEIYDLEHKDIYEFFLDQDCRVWYNFCLDSVGYFVSGDPIYLAVFKYSVDN